MIDFPESDPYTQLENPLFRRPDRVRWSFFVTSQTSAMSRVMWRGGEILADWYSRPCIEKSFVELTKVVVFRRQDSHVLNVPE